MKVLKTDNQIISLENVREVKISTHSTVHTHYGTKIEDIWYTITIYYIDDATVEIRCGKNKDGEDYSKSLMEEIYHILKELE